MKTLIPAILAIAVVSTASMAGAGEPPAPMMDAQLNAQQQQQVQQLMAQAHAQVTKLHHDAHVAVLNALTPQHRQLLAQLVGNLVLSPDASLDSVAQELNTTLTPSETQAITSIATSLHQQTQQTFAAVHAQMQKIVPDAQHPEGPRMEMRVLNKGPQDAGHALLMLTLPGHDMHFMGMRGLH